MKDLPLPLTKILLHYSPDEVLVGTVSSARDIMGKIGPSETAFNKSRSVLPQMTICIIMVNRRALSSIKIYSEE